LSALVATLVLFLTVVASVGLGIVAASWAVNAILFLFGTRRTERLGPILVPSQSQGD
jgi:hypothetical protein